MVAAVMAVAWAVVHMAGGHRRRGVLVNVDTVACLECCRPKGRASHVVGGFWCSTASVSCATSCKNWNLGARPILRAGLSHKCFCSKETLEEHLAERKKDPRAGRGSGVLLKNEQNELLSKKEISARVHSGSAIAITEAMAPFLSLFRCSSFFQGRMMQDVDVENPAARRSHFFPLFWSLFSPLLLLPLLWSISAMSEAF